MSTLANITSLNLSLQTGGAALAVKAASRLVAPSRRLYVFGGASDVFPYFSTFANAITYANSLTPSTSNPVSVVLLSNTDGTPVAISGADNWYALFNDGIIVDSPYGGLNNVPSAPVAGSDNLSGRVEVISCVIRNTAGTWSFINDSTHVPVGFTSVTALAGGRIQLNYNKTYTKVIALQCTPDETYAKYGITMGASVGTNLSYIDLYKNDPGFYIRWSGSAWEKFGDTYDIITSIVYTDVTGLLRINHVNLGVDSGFDCQITGRNDTLSPVAGSIGETQTEVFFKNPDGTIYTGVPTTGMRVFIKRGGSVMLSETTAAISGSNIWITGYMLKS
jgi:hypothetical protein